MSAVTLGGAAAYVALIRLRISRGTPDSLMHTSKRILAYHSYVGVIVLIPTSTYSSLINYIVDLEASVETEDFISGS